MIESNAGNKAREAAEHSIAAQPFELTFDPNATVVEPGNEHRFTLAERERRRRDAANQVVAKGEISK